MPRIVQLERHTCTGVLPSTVGHRPHPLQRTLDIVEVEKGRHERLVRRAPTVVAIGLSGGEVGRVAQHDRQQVAASGIGVDRSAEAALHEQRQPAAVVDMRMAQDHCVDGVRLERERPAVAGARIATALQHAAVEQDLPTGHPQDVAGAGHLTRRAVELDLHGFLPLQGPPSWVIMHRVGYILPQSRQENDFDHT
ncbi:MAG: hypothetical protein LW605_08545 [Xanthomonadales bacterium]|nr:hypothetical protein [Xanthomonadales bacterium]